MSIEITPVGPHGFVGPGIPVNIIFQPPGGFPFPGFIEWGIYTDVEGTQSVLRQQRVSNIGPSMSWTPMAFFQEPLQGVLNMPADGDSVRVLIKAFVGSTQVDSGSIQATWHDDEGVWYQVWQLLSTINAKPTGGLTTTQATQLELSSQATAAARMSIGPGSLAAYGFNALSQLDNPGYFFLCSVDATDSVSGSGELAVPTLLRPSYTAGFSFQFTGVPVGMGRIDGASVTWQNRILQTVVRYRLHGAAGPVLDQDVTDWRSDQRIFIFDPVLPLSVAYHVTPGCEVKFFWLQACPNP